jgi:chromosome segregation ATPase
MGDFSRKIDVDKLVSYSDDLVEVLKDKKDMNNFSQCLKQSNTLQSSCNSDFDEVQCSILDYQRKIDECKRKIEEAKIEVAEEAEEDNLQNELQQELEKEHALREELRGIITEIADLEHQRNSVEERRQTLRKLEKEALKTERMLSMYTSVTNIVPNLDDQSKISGYIVDKDKNMVEKFEVDPSKPTPFGTSCSIWKLIH